MSFNVYADEGSVEKFFYCKYFNIIYEDYYGEFTVEFNADMYGFPSAGWFFSWWGVRYDVWAPDEVTLAVAARLATKALFPRSFPRHSSAAITPTNESPAPRVLTAFTGFAAMCLTTEPVP